MNLFVYEIVYYLFALCLCSPQIDALFGRGRFFLAFDLACCYQKTSLLNEFYVAIEVAALEFLA